MTLEFAHAVVYVVDMDEMISFYTDVLGFQVTDRGPVGGDGGREIVFLSNHPSHHHQIAFLNMRDEVEASNSVNHLAFRASDLDAVKSTIAALEADGRASKLSPLTHGNAWSIYFSDPEQNGVEIFCDSPFHVAQPQGRPWDTSLDEQQLTEWTREQFTDEQRFGPIEDFYETHRAAIESGVGAQGS